MAEPTKPLRTQYVFDLSGVKYKSSTDILNMRRQWESFETIENYNDVIYQRFQLGLRDKPYWQFRNREEMNDYRVGQQLHGLRYPYLPSSTFDSISTRPMPDVPVIKKPSDYSQVSRDILAPTPILGSELIEREGDFAIYMHVSSFNSAHKYKYAFASNEEQLAYHRAERIIRTGTS
jgi:hypothetical protein